MIFIYLFIYFFTSVASFACVASALAVGLLIFSAPVFTDRAAVQSHAHADSDATAQEAYRFF